MSSINAILDVQSVESTLANFVNRNYLVFNKTIQTHEKKAFFSWPFSDCMDFFRNGDRRIDRDAENGDAEIAGTKSIQALQASRN